MARGENEPPRMGCCFCCTAGAKAVRRLAFKDETENPDTAEEYWDEVKYRDARIADAVASFILLVH